MHPGTPAGPQLQPMPAAKLRFCPLPLKSRSPQPRLQDAEEMCLRGSFACDNAIIKVEHTEVWESLVRRVNAPMMYGWIANANKRLVPAAHIAGHLWRSGRLCRRRLSWKMICSMSRSVGLKKGSVGGLGPGLQIC